MDTAKSMESLNQMRRKLNAKNFIGNALIGIGGATLANEVLVTGQLCWNVAETDETTPVVTVTELLSVAAIGYGIHLKSQAKQDMINEEIEESFLEDALAFDYISSEIFDEDEGETPTVNDCEDKDE